MRYISDDGRVFNTEYECCEHEQKIKHEKENKEKFELERQNDLLTINKQYKELQKLILDFEKKYCVRQNRILRHLMN